jgi:hypothetical protein
VTSPRDRDAATDRLLRQVMQGSSAPRTEVCLDAETLAAWFDDRLSGAALESVEQHVADCAHCQAMLGAFVRSDLPAQEAAGRAPKWFGWLVPVAAAAALVIVAVVTLRPDRAVEAPETMAEAPRQEAFADSREAVPPPAPPPAPAEPERRADAAAGRNAAAPPAAVPTPPPARQALERPSFRREVDTLAKAEATPIEIATPDDRIRWRLAGSVIQRTTDDGSTWEVVNSPENLDAILTAGSSPTPTVLWAAGQAGVVLLTTDGRTARLVAFPEAVDLTAVEATDRQTATVTTADGRRFRTSDGGGTWTPSGGGRGFSPGV